MEKDKAYFGLYILIYTEYLYVNTFFSPSLKFCLGEGADFNTPQIRFIKNKKS